MSGLRKRSQQNTGERAEQKKKHARGLTRLVKAMNEYSGALLAAFTALLAVVTALLWWATRDLVRRAEATAKKNNIALTSSRLGATRATSAPLYRTSLNANQKCWSNSSVQNDYLDCYKLRRKFF